MTKPRLHPNTWLEETVKLCPQCRGIGESHVVAGVDCHPCRGKGFIVLWTRILQNCTEPFLQVHD